jgi:hypothetical protein
MLHSLFLLFWILSAITVACEVDSPLHIDRWIFGEESIKCYKIKNGIDGEISFGRSIACDIELLWPHYIECGFNKSTLTWKCEQSNLMSTEPLVYCPMVSIVTYDTLCNISVKRDCMIIFDPMDGLMLIIGITLILIILLFIIVVTIVLVSTNCLFYFDTPHLTLLERRQLYKRNAYKK